MSDINMDFTSLYPSTMRSYSKEFYEELEKMRIKKLIKHRNVVIDNILEDNDE